jgi:hypothetical protein
MYLLYLDESGSPKQQDQKYLVLAGFCVFERQGYWIEQELNKIASRFDPADPASVELHGSPMYSRRDRWKSFDFPERIAAIKDSLQAFIRTDSRNRIFISVIDKALASPKDPVEVAFEQLASRFDMYLKRLHNKGDTQRGVIIFDKSTYETVIQGLATDFRTVGYTWGVINNLSEVPLFLDSKASRLIQLADLIAYSTFRCFEREDSQFFDIFKHRIDSEGGVTHGLYRNF